MKNLSIVVVGAGIGGLSTALALASDGHRVTVLDAVEEFAEVGAGIRVPPNSSLLLRNWGVELDIPNVVSLGNRFMDWKDNILVDIPYSYLKEKYGIPYYLLHRADLVNVLLKTAKAHDRIKIVTRSFVVAYDFSKPAAKVATGHSYSGDLVVSAEGIKSSIRNTIHGGEIRLRDTGDVAYRILVPSEPLLKDPKTRHLVEQPWATHWLGPEGHAVGYPLRRGSLYNIIIDITHATDKGKPIEENQWRMSADNTEIVERFKDWCYPVRKLCGLTGEYLKWKLVDLEKPLARWVHPEGRVVLLGDACHPMMPYMAQGAAQAIEDAGALRAALGQCDDLHEALKVYEASRKPRAEYIVQNTRILQEWLHLYDGPDRQERDKLMTYKDERNPIFWADPKRMDWLFAFRADDLNHLKSFPVPELPPSPSRSVYSSQL